MHLQRIITAFLLLAALPASAALPSVSHVAPKMANFYLPWTLSEAEARSLARWDLVVLDMEVQSNNPESIRLMRALNPNIRILAYVAASEIRSDAASLASVSPLRRDLLASIPSSWFVTDGNGNRRSFWSGTWIVNATNLAPLAGGERWNTFLPRFVKSRILATGLWDGVMYDNAWENISFFAGGTVDLDGDNRAESRDAADRAWREGLAVIYRQTRAANPSFLVLQNDGPLYASEVHGLQFENFPQRGWSQTADGLVQTGGKVLPPGLVVLNANTGNTGNRNDYRSFRYGLATALLFDSYYGFDYGDQNHGQLWWYDEYDSELGLPGAAPTRLDGAPGRWREGVWRRDYGRGVVLANSGTAPKNVDLGGEYERLRGTQDAGTNNGRIVSSLELPPKDGIVLLKTLGDVRGAAFQNGTFVRVLDSRGQAKRTGFYLSVPRFANGATILTRVQGGKNRELIVAESGRVRIFDQANRPLADFAPFGRDVRGGLSLAVLERPAEGPLLLVSPRESGGGLVRLYTLGGTRVGEFRAFSQTYTGGVHVASGDVLGDGRSEIVVGAGTGGGPHVRIFRSDGTLLSPGFFAYDPKFRGGVRLAVGDVTGDGRSEIVVGAGTGGGPHVRIFTGTGELSGQFFPFSPSGRSGVSVGAADIDGDGVLEILAFSANALGQ